jgi:hypothetical protein
MYAPSVDMSMTQQKVIHKPVLMQGQHLNISLIIGSVQFSEQEKTPLRSNKREKTQVNYIKK